ncbi:hypothetical protein [Lentzea nigeriaca]|nr:hypothetical protein [Lentzea nigeriaca]MBM7859912.1 hypothetical protein [Lentzea nigeriaca]
MAHAPASVRSLVIEAIVLELVTSRLGSLFVRVATALKPSD